MKKLLNVLLVLLSIQIANAQIRAVTSEGDEVLLHENGQWEYFKESPNELIEIPNNEQSYVKDKKATFLVKSNVLKNVGIWINPKVWSFKKGEEGGITEYEFDKKGDDLFAMMISEKSQIPLETLKQLAFENARSVAPDMKVLKEEYRTVNNTEVIMMQMAGTIQGTRFSYFGYYFSNKDGVVQLLAYCTENLFNGYISDIETFLNGFVNQSK
ncbi:MAG: hypothetical protein LC105_09755 [Chitinophagales bacterium]|nr:hypothetical protein [Chitinophagales bacterium]MCZ2394130.1 hypothetical protein [Chitinophagales bacterium]